MMWRCADCGYVFEEPRTIETTYEDYLACPIPGHTPLTLTVCPHCGDEGIEEFNEEEKEDD